MFGVRTTTIARWARAGRLEAVRTPGGHRRYRLSEIRELSGTAPAEPGTRRETGHSPGEERGVLFPGPWPIVSEPKERRWRSDT
jgi:excisionase family DNA binding protein